MYHLFENELDSISTFNAQAVGCFSVGSTLIGFIFSIVVSYGFSGQSISELGQFLLYKTSWFLGLIAIMCYALGVWFLIKKKSIVARVKAETNANPQELVAP